MMTIQLTYITLILSSCQQVYRIFRLYQLLIWDQFAAVMTEYLLHEIKMPNHAIEQSRAQCVNSFFSTDIAPSALFLEEESVVPVQALPLANDTDTSSLIDVKEQENDNFESFHYSICLEKYKPVDRISLAKNEQTPCHRHLYHEDCIKVWLMKNDNCPYCRRSYFGV